MKKINPIVYFIASVQTMFLLGHLVFYFSLLFLFPTLKNSRSLLPSIIAISFLFILSTIIDHWRENFFTRWLFILGAVSLPWGFYLFLAAIAGVITKFIFPYNNLEPLYVIYLAATVLPIIYGLINARRIVVTKQDIYLQNLPEFWENKTAVVASDIHLGHILRTKYGLKVAEAINNLGPDIVFIPGDFFDGVHTNFQKLADTFREVKPPLGVYFSSGNHELYAGEKQCETALANAGVKILEDQMVEVNGLQIAGIAYHKEIIPNLSLMLNSLNLDSTKPTILLKHVPHQMTEVQNAGIDLQLSGHTHNGQVWPFTWIVQNYFKGFAYGLKQFGKLQVYISSGIGTWGPPMKLGSKPEIVKITFHNKKTSPD